MREPLRVLVIDDEEAMRESLAAWLRKEGYRVSVAAGGVDGLAQLSDRQFDLLLVDMKMPGMDGLAVLERVQEIRSDLPVVMITAYGSIESAVTAMKMGARDYLLKPFDPEQMLLVIERIVDHQELERENEALRERLRQSARDGVGDLVAGSEAMIDVLELIQDVAPTDAAVLITGETGTGKELVARAIHASSSCAYGPFVVINCGAQSEALLESALFGHERGAFTGAVATQRGRLEMAHGGTLFLDEVGEIPTKMQLDLLRVLEDRQFTRVGGAKPLESDFRLICATHRDLPAQIKSGGFRADFFYRINVLEVRLPPLREREGDVELLAGYFVDQFARKLGKSIQGFTSEGLGLLRGYTWPGNVRELRNVLERAVVICRADQIGARELTFLASGDPDVVVPMTLREAEICHVRRALDAADWNITHAARALGIDRVTLSRKIKRHDLSRMK
jgi:two-component system, NtrC family, response regulator HydG